MLQHLIQLTMTAQTAAAAPAPQVHQSALGAVASFYKDGGVWMHPITIVGVIALACIIERIVQIFFRYSINASAFMAQIHKLVMANNIDRAIKLCNAAPAALLPRVIKAGLTRANKGEVEVSNAIEEATLDALPELNKRTPMLPNLANLATLCGLLGTIVGLIEAFSAVASAPPDMKSQLLTKSLAIGLNATAFGLLVAIPSLAGFLFLNSATRRIMEEIDLHSFKLQNMLTARGRGQLPQTPSQTA
ncbi:MAG: MotA/TolQ/ExbB proton channel family protein [Clostridia bacterium]|nr:MotA/TolQ/ExbB proton channel family protein [Deltaproteobacteria bacterium]